MPCPYTARLRRLNKDSHAPQAAVGNIARGTFESTFPPMSAIQSRVSLVLPANKRRRRGTL